MNIGKEGKKEEEELRKRVKEGKGREGKGRKKTEVIKS